MSMPADEVLVTLRGLAAAGVDCWVDGGWGVDALLEEQTRPHDDLDLVVDADHLAAAREWLTGNGYEVIRDWLPTAIAFRRADGAEVDLHPVRRTADGGGDQVQPDGGTYHYREPSMGWIARTDVRCCSLADQVECHTGYPPTPVDRQDMRLLAKEFDLELPPPYDA
jgi:lincosamide nucleotidyltransferase A/C/D/E